MINGGSNLLKENESSVLCSFFPGQRFNLKLIYRGTRDGFTKESFHMNVVASSPTITVVKPEKDQLFGGYTKSVWYMQDD